MALFGTALAYMKTSGQLDMFSTAQEIVFPRTCALNECKFDVNVSIMYTWMLHKFTDSFKAFVAIGSYIDVSPSRLTLNCSRT